MPELTPQHNWHNHPWEANDRPDRLYQGPFPAELSADWGVVMTTLPSTEIVPNYGMGLVNYILGDQLPKVKPGETMEQCIEAIAAIPMGNKLYLRPTWRQMQSQPGKLNPFDPWKVALEMAEKYHKRIGFRIFLANPDIEDESLPDFVLEKVPLHRLGHGWASEDGVRSKEIRARKTHFLPHYQHPAFRAALDEFDALLAEQFNGHPLIEFVDTYMYGFWGEGHSWPFETSPFPDPVTAQETWLDIFEMQRRHWDKTPLVTNTQPDLQRVGVEDLAGDARAHRRALRRGQGRDDGRQDAGQQQPAGGRPSGRGGATRACTTHQRAHAPNIGRRFWAHTSREANTQSG